MRISSLLLPLTVTAMLPELTLGLVISRREGPCNGSDKLCNRPYGLVTFLGAHDSFAISSSDLDIATDQHVGITEQLNKGVRMLQGQMHKDGNELKLCHTSCLLENGGKLSDFLGKVKKFMDKNPREVVTLILTNPNKVPAKEWKPSFAAAGIDNKLMFVPPNPKKPIPAKDWPTLGQMIDSGKRLVTFLDTGAEGGVEPTLIHEFDNIWEPDFSVTDPAFPCAPKRHTGPLKPEVMMYMLNHNLNKKFLGAVIPDREDIDKTNSVQSIRANANGCKKLAQGRNPTFVMLDFVDKGEGKKAVDLLNGV